MTMAGALMMRLNYSLLALRRLNFAFGSQSILLCHSGFPFSTLADDNGSVIHHLQNPFARFAFTKFQLSAADISLMFKRFPTLQRLQTLDKVEEFVGKLEENGFKQEQIASIIRRMPMLLGVSTKEVTEPKLQVLKDSGIRGEHLVKILTNRPLILCFSLEKELIPRVTLLQNLFQSQDLFLKAVLRYSSILTYNMENTLKPSVAFWEGCGFRGMELAKFLLLQPSLLCYASLTHAQVDLIDKIGIDKGSKMYRHVLNVVITSRMKTLEAKIHNFQLCGLSYEETMELLRLSPYIFRLTQENVRARMDFIVNEMELPPNLVIKHRAMMLRNLEKVVKPRCLVWKKLKSMNGSENLKTQSLRTILDMREAEFVTRIVKGHLEAATLYAIYEKAVANASSSTGTNISKRSFC